MKLYRMKMYHGNLEIVSRVSFSRSNFKASILNYNLPQAEIVSSSIFCCSNCIANL